MKILKESKEKLPIDFITQFVSKGWEEVGNLKASCDAIKKEFKDTKAVEDILQGLIDSYLIALGQMELHLDKKDYVEIPEKEDLKEDLSELNEAEAKPVQALKYEGEKCVDGKCCKKTEIFTELPDYDVEVEQKGKKIEIELDPKKASYIGNEEMVGGESSDDEEWPEAGKADMSDIENILTPEVNSSTPVQAPVQDVAQAQTNYLEDQVGFKVDAEDLVDKWPESNKETELEIGEPEIINQNKDIFEIEDFDDYKQDNKKAKFTLDDAFDLF